MAFPTTSVLDDFNRADGGLGSSWTSPMYPGDYTPTIISNVADNASGWASSYRNATQYGPDVEVFGKIGSTGFGHLLLWRCSNPGNGSTFTAYSAHFETDGSLTVRRFVNFVETIISTQSSLGFTNTNQVGVSHIGGTIRFYRSGSEVGTPVTGENTISSAGYIGFRQFVGGPVDDFGGGSIASSSAHIDALVGQ